MSKSGTPRFQRIRASVEAGRSTAPVDLRYLRGVRKLDKTGDSQRAHVLTFLEQVYESQAETLPDVRDEPASDVHVAQFKLNIGQQEVFKDVYAECDVEHLNQSLEPKVRKLRKHCRSVKINPDRVNEEPRFLPPGTMFDVWQQMKASNPSCSVSFPQFWRIWKAEYPHMKFRAHSSHALCSVCVRHKCLIKEFSNHLKAQAAQQEHYIRHLESQFRDRCSYWRARACSRLRSSPEVCVIMDSMDQAKFGCPRGNIYRSKNLSSLQRPRLHITCAICHGYFIAFSVSTPDMPKDSSTMVELFSHCLTLLQDKHNVDLRRSSIILQTDNTPREFKNNMMLRYMAWLISNGVLSSVSLRCLRTGHSHEDVDQVFGQLAKHLVHRVRSVASPLEYVSRIQSWLDSGLKRDFEKGRYCFLLDQARNWILGPKILNLTLILNHCF